MKPLRIFVGLLVVAGIAGLLWSQTTPFLTTPLPLLPVKPVSGAAVFYKQAFAAMPELKEKEKKLLSTKPDQPLDTVAATQLVEKLEPRLRLLEQGGKEPGCEWGLDFNRWDLGTDTFPADGMRLAKVLALRARLHLEAGDAPAAATDLLLGLQFARQIGEPSLLICKLVQINMDMTLIGITMRYLNQFDTVTLHKLSGEVAAQSAPHSMAEVVLFEKQLVPYTVRWFLEDMKTNAARAPWQERLQYWCISWMPNWSFLRFSHTSLKQMNLWIAETQSRYDELAGLMKLPYAQGRLPMKAFDEKIKSEVGSNFVMSVTLPGISGVRRYESQRDAAWAILPTALNAQLRDPGSVRGELAKLRDPYDDQPLAMRDVEGGVEIQLKSDPGKKPVTLMVGLSGK